MESARIDMSYADFIKLQQRGEENEKLVVALRAEIAELKTRSVSSDPILVQRLIDGLLAARTVALFSTGQLPPEEIKGWPKEAVKTLGEALLFLKDLVATEPDLRYHADDLLAFVKTIADAEAVRASR